MIINDLQYIEAANEEVTGAGYKGWGGWSYKKPSYNQAGAGATAEAFGYNTKGNTFTDTLTVEGEFSGAVSRSDSESF